MRQVEQDSTHTDQGEELNPLIYIYDTSGPYTDPTVNIDLLQGLPELRGQWITERDDTEQLAGPTSEYGAQRQSDHSLANLRFEHIRAPRRAKAGGCLMEMRQFMEKFYSANFQYDQDTGGNAVTLPAPECVTDLAGFYGFENGGAPATVASQTYTLTATAQGTQLSDRRNCGNLTVDQAGSKGASGGGTVAECWRQ